MISKPTVATMCLAVVFAMVLPNTSQADVFVITSGGETNFGNGLIDALNAAQSNDIVEIRDNSTYLLPNNFQGYTLTTPDITLRSAVGYKATIRSDSGGTGGMFEVNAANETFENLTFQAGTQYGVYAFWFGGTKDGDYNYASKGLTVRDVDFNATRGVICAGSGWVKDLTFENNSVNDSDYGLGKSGMNYGSDCVITGNTFTTSGTMADKSAPAEPALWLESLVGGANLTIANNTFSDSDDRYAIYSDVVDIADLTLSGNVFDMSSGGTGAQLNLVPLSGGGYAIGLVPEPATLSLLALGGMALIRRRRTA